MQKELVNRATAKENYDELTDELMELREKKQNILSARAQEHGKIMMKEQTLQFLSRQTSKLKEFDDNLVRKLIEQVIIHPDTTMTVVFKSGTKIDV